MFSPTYPLIETRKLDVPFNLEIDYGLPSRVLKGFIVAIRLSNNGGGIRSFSNSLTLSFKITFLFFIYPIHISKASPMASWNYMTLEGGTS
jgi:hypothetical protein